MSERLALIGAGYLGSAYSRIYPEAVIYDEPNINTEWGGVTYKDHQTAVQAGRMAVNECVMALVAVPTDPSEAGELDMSIVESVVGWLETDDILIKSALQPGTVDRLVEKTGKNIAISVEYVGMGKYFMPPDKYPHPTDPSQHKLLVVGGEISVAERCAGRLWNKMSPDTRIHLITAREAEIVKLTENFYGALKVTFANCLFNLVHSSGQSFVRVHQAWSEDGRTDPMHTRVTEGKRGWKSHCYDKDIDAFRAEAVKVGATDMARLAQTIIELNKEHLEQND